MATKYGEAAFRHWAGVKAAFKARRNMIFGITAIIVIYLVLDYYIF